MTNDPFLQVAINQAKEGFAASGISADHIMSRALIAPRPEYLNGDSGE